MTPGGKRDALQLGERLAHLKWCPEVFLSSAARRAVQTSRILSETVFGSSESVHFQKDLYLAAPATILEVVNREAGNARSVAVVAHNPGLTELVCYLTGDVISALPTCGHVHLQFDCSDWNLLSRGMGTMVSIQE